jgi:8-oxo-dGTP pyrophosphatase MutT (NUDIX family)
MKTMPHFHPTLDWAAVVLIAHEGRVLFAHHRGMNRWVPVGGHIEPGEDPEAAALREAREETGLDVELVGSPALADEPGYRAMRRPEFVDVHQVNGEHWHLGLVYFARVKGGELRLAPDEHHDIRWFAETELSDPRWGLTRPLIEYARAALRSTR